MKNVILTSILLLFVLSSYSQNSLSKFLKGKNEDGVYYEKEKTPEINQIVISDTLAYVLASTIQMQENLQKYYKARSIGYALTGISLGLSVVSTQMEEDYQQPVILGAAVMGGFGILQFIAAEKWLKKSAIKPSKTGIGIEITF